MTMKKYELSYSEQMQAVFNSSLPYYVFETKQAVNPALLKEAAIAALELHPLYKTKIEKDENGFFYLSENDREPVIKESVWEDGIVYGTEEYNEFPWLITYTGTKIVFTASHTLSDGMGGMNFIRSVLRLYFEKQGVKFSGVDIAPEDVERTTEQMHLTCCDDSVIPVGKPKPAQIISTDPSLYETDPDKAAVYRFRFDKKEIKIQAANSETSLFAVIAYYLAKAMELTVQKSEGNIRLQVPYNMRSAFGGITDRNFAELTVLNYSIEKMGKLSEQLVETAFRSQLDVFVDKTNLIAKNNEIAAMTKAMKANPGMLTGVAEYLQGAIYAPQACVTYTHFTQLGIPAELDGQLRGVDITLKKDTSNLIAVVGCNFRDRVTLTVGQSTKNDVFIDNLRKAFDSGNLTYTFELVVPHGEMRYESRAYEK